MRAKISEKRRILFVGIIDFLKKGVSRFYHFKELFDAFIKLRKK